MSSQNRRIGPNDTQCPYGQPIISSLPQQGVLFAAFGEVEYLSVQRESFHITNHQGARPAMLASLGCVAGLESSPDSAAQCGEALRAPTLLAPYCPIGSSGVKYSALSRVVVLSSKRPTPPTSRILPLDRGVAVKSARSLWEVAVVVRAL